jgi:hypothetical protein
MVDRGLLLQVLGHAIYIATQISLAEHIEGDYVAMGIRVSEVMTTSWVCQCLLKYTITEKTHHTS